MAKRRWQRCRKCNELKVPYGGGVCNNRNCAAYNPFSEKEEQTILEMEAKGLPINLASCHTYSLQQNLPKYTDHELIESFNSHVGKQFWVAAKGRHIHALIGEMQRRNWDIRAIYSFGTIHLSQKITLEGKTIKIK